MITVHHIVNSRSQRIIWMLEELDCDYELVIHDRDPATNLAPAALKSAHRLGKAPTVVIGGQALGESGAILEYLAETLGEGRLGVAPGAPGRADYLYWLHFGEGTLMPAFVLAMQAGRLGEPAAALAAYASGEIDARLAHMDAELAGRDFLVGADFTAADVHNGYCADVAAQYGKLAAHPNLARYRQALRQRPAYRRAVEKGGPFTLGQAA